MKEPQMFSNKEQKTYLEKYIASPSNHRINGITAKIRCRLCSGEQVNERQCEGPCGEWKALDRYSKSQRTRGSGWCQECVLWKEAAEPGMVTEAAPNTMLAPDEYDEVEEPVPAARSYTGVQFNVGNLEEGDDRGGESDDDYNYKSTIQTAASTLKVLPYAGIVNGIAGLKVGDPQHPTKAIPQAKTSTANSKMEYIPPHLRSSVGSAAAKNGYVPPHMRGNAVLTKPAPLPVSTPAATSVVTASSASNPYEISQSVTSSHPWSAVDTRRRVPESITFNGFDNTGEKHTQQRLASGETSVTDQSPIPVPPAVVPSRRGNWARAVSYISFLCSKPYDN